MNSSEITAEYRRLKGLGFTAKRARESLGISESRLYQALGAAGAGSNRPLRLNIPRTNEAYGRWQAGDSMQDVGFALNCTTGRVSQLITQYFRFRGMGYIEQAEAKAVARQQRKVREVGVE